MSTEEPQTPQDTQPGSLPEKKAALWQNENEYKRLMDHYLLFKRSFLDHGGDWVEFYNMRFFPSLRRLVGERGLSAENLTHYAAYHALIGSSVDVEELPNFDTPDKIIEESFFELCAEELGQISVEGYQ